MNSVQFRNVNSGLLQYTFINYLIISVGQKFGNHLSSSGPGLVKRFLSRCWRGTVILTEIEELTANKAHCHGCCWEVPVQPYWLLVEGFSFSPFGSLETDRKGKREKGGRGAATDHRKHSGIAQHTCIVAQFWRSGVLKSLGWQGCSSWRLGYNPLPWIFFQL